MTEYPIGSGFNRTHGKRRRKRTRYVAGAPFWWGRWSGRELALFLTPGRRVPFELLARLLMHIPAPRLHLVRYYGRYSHVARARRRREMEAVPGAGPQVPGADFLATGSPDDELSRAERRRLRRGWAQLIRRVYEADPLLCHRRTRCPGLMRAPHGRRTDRPSRSTCASITPESAPTARAPRR